MLSKLEQHFKKLYDSEIQQWQAVFVVFNNFPWDIFWLTVNVYWHQLNSLKPQFVGRCMFWCACMCQKIKSPEIWKYFQHWNKTQTHACMYIFLCLTKCRKVRKSWVKFLTVNKKWSNCVGVTFRECSEMAQKTVDTLKTFMLRYLHEKAI